MPIRIAPAGDDAVLADLGEISLEALHAAAAAARERLRPSACIPGRNSLLLISPGVAVSAEDISSILGEATATPASVPSRRHELRVSFAPENAPDLPRLLERAGISREQFLDAVRRLRLRARYLGFRAGFAYLEGLPPAWSLPRLPAPRRSVPAGSFSVAADVAGFYPIASPGGWNLLGRTDAMLWDPDRTPPNLIAAGDEITIAPDDTLSFAHPDRQPPAQGPATEAATVVMPGQFTCIVRRPDPGRYQFGLPAGGAWDPEALDAANLAVGNAPEAAALECALVGPRLRFARETLVSWFGAPAAAAVNGVSVRDSRLFAVRAGDLLDLGRLGRGGRGYLAIRGGVSDPAARYAIEPVRLGRGDTIGSGELEGGSGRVRSMDFRAPLTLRCMAGPHAAPSSWLERVAGEPWTVTAADRVAVRFGGPPPPDLPATLPSAGMQVGTVQWHPGGELVAMGPDHPITGGYLQIVTVLTADRPALGYLQAGDVVRFEIRERYSEQMTDEQMSR